MTEPSAPQSAEPARPSESGDESLRPGPDTGVVTIDPALRPEEPGVPAVVAVIIARDPGTEFEETLDSFSAQDYPNLSILVIDSASAQPLADRVADRLPDAFIHRHSGSPTFASSANQALTLVSGASFLLLCTDDVALDPTCVSAMVEEVYRSNAAVVAPKMVRWDDPRRLGSIGRGSDRFGVQVDLVEPDEFDQDQYDRVRDVFVAPSGATLIRSDLFAELGGYDTGLNFLNADLDLCWRAHAAGARVIAVPNAKVRARDTHPLEGDENDHRRDLGRGRLRTVLITATPFSLLRTVPLAVFLLVLEGIYSLIAGRRRQAMAAFGVISWNLTNLGDIRARRRQLAEVRKVSDREVAALQVGGSARLTGYFQGQFGAGQDRLAGVVGNVRTSLSGDDGEANRNGALIGMVVLFFLVFGSRHLITRGTVQVGQFPDLPSISALLGEWWGGWRSVNTGSPGNPPSALFALGLGKLAFFWADGLFDLLLAIGPIFFGAYGAWRLARPFNSYRASAIAAVVYAANPLPVVAMGAGRWDALVVWAAAPAILGSLLRVQGLAPFGRTGGVPGPSVVDRDVPTRLVRFGLLVTAVATFVPVVGVLAGFIALLFAAAAIAVARPAGIVRLFMAAVVALIAPIALHGPWAFDVLSRFSWSRLVGPKSPEATFDSLADLVRFAPGGLGPSLLTFGLLMAAGIALLIGRGARFDLAASGWIVALGTWAIPWLDRRELISFASPTAEIMLAPAAAGLALAAGAGMRAIEVDLGDKRRVGWRQVVALIGVGAMFAGGLGGVRASLNGRWEMPTQSYGDFTALLADNVAARTGTTGPARVLWLAHPSIAPADTVTSAGGAHFFVTEGGRPLVSSRWSSGPAGFDQEIADRLDLAANGETIRVGQLLAAYGIDLVIVMPQLAPAPYIGPLVSPDDNPSTGVVRVLANQLDLERVPGAPNLVVYRNAVSDGPAVSAPGLAEQSSDPLVALSLDPNAQTRVPLTQTGAGSWAGFAPVEDELRLAVPAKGWVATSDNGDVDDLGSATGMLVVDGSDLADDGEFDLSYQTPLIRRLALIGQLLLLAVGAILAQGRRDDRPSSRDRVVTP